MNKNSYRADDEIGKVDILGTERRDGLFHYNTEGDQGMETFRQHRHPLFCLS
ncbi:MAG: hypothetical protein J0652_05220 [Desulfobulbaceae bacterium]|jgi:hypothetical protein|nr:hypothetical protein [Desulfobulbaceae bacterium]